MVDDGISPICKKTIDELARIRTKLANSVSGSVSIELFKDNYLAALISEVMLISQIQSWTETLPKSASPGEIMDVVQEVVRRTKEAAEFMDEGSEYTITVKRNRRPA
jgi:hypothetical protein